jgi:hypothetical protein
VQDSWAGPGGGISGFVMNIDIKCLEAWRQVYCDIENPASLYSRGKNRLMMRIEKIEPARENVRTHHRNQAESGQMVNDAQFRERPV